MTEKQITLLFKFSALFNMVIALTLLLATDLFIEIFQMGDAVTQPVFVHLFAIVVLAFSGLYYYISKHPSQSRAVMYFGMYAKLGVVAVCLFDTLLGNVFWTINIPASGDLIFAVLFYQAAKSQAVKD
ncbi:MAG: hypothetical protein COB83_10740 [Gammaproteobacteria bacterium]|nr:MAG: hypothetical protein COB83_10740 [Gammaproteobacteria bacterium]